MAFFNHWSSERLSFSLSIVAVISAAITSYYQFFYHSTEVSYFRERSHLSELPALVNGAYHDSVVGSITFFNRGSTPVSIISSAIILDGDTAEIPDDFRENPNVTFNIFWGGRNSLASEVHSKHYLDAKSVSEFRFKAKIDSSEFQKVVRSSPTAAHDSTQVNLNYRLWFLMADPYGNFSLEAVKIGIHAYNISGRYIFKVGEANWVQTRQMPPFQNIDFWKDLTYEKTQKRAREENWMFEREIRRLTMGPKPEASFNE